MPDLPAPLTPPECDLRGMPYMALDLVRLFESDFYALSTGEEFKAALTLWGKSFYQMPGGSLPDDERLLAHLSGAKRWEVVKKMALKGWVKCADGRLYHPTVAQKAMEAWRSRVLRRARTEAARAARLEQWHANERDDASVTGSVTDTATDTVTSTNRTKQKQREQILKESRLCDSWGVDSRKAGAEGNPPEGTQAEEFDQFWQLYPRKIGKGQARRAFGAALKKASAAQILAALQKQPFHPQERFQPHPATWLNGERWLDEQSQQDPVLRAAGVVADTCQPSPAWDALT